jgi:hypothetical protein
VRRTEADVGSAGDDTRLRGQMWQRGAEIRILPARPFASMVRTDWERWGAIAKATGARAEQ